jgi:hypothetical protein
MPELRLCAAAGTANQTEWLTATRPRRLEDRSRSLGRALGKVEAFCGPEIRRVCPNRQRGSTYSCCGPAQWRSLSLFPLDSGTASLVFGRWCCAGWRSRSQAGRSLRKLLLRDDRNRITTERPRRAENSGRAPTAAGVGVEPQTERVCPPALSLFQGCRCAQVPSSRVPGGRSRIAATRVIR